MKKKRIRFLADAIVSDFDRPFNMAGHATCLIDWCRHLWPQDCEKPGEAWICAHEARGALGLTVGEAEELFLPPGSDGKLAGLTRHKVADVLRTLADTGKIEWGFTRNDD